MGYNYIPKYIRQSENKSPKSVVTASRWNELFNLLIQQGDHTAEELGKILDYLSTGLEDLTSEKLDKTGGVISGNLGVTGALNIGTTVAVTETNVNLLKLTGDYGAPVTIRNVATPSADNDAATKAYVQNYHDNTKQDIITDLVTIRSGASKGSTAVQPESGKGLFSGNYNDLTNKPTIPAVPQNISAFTNDSGYLTLETLPKYGGEVV